LREKLSEIHYARGQAMTKELVRLYDGKKCYEIDTCGLKRVLPIRQVGDGVWIASNHILVLGDLEFIEAAAKDLASRLSKYEIELIVTAEAKAGPLAYEVSKKLDLPYLVVCRKSVKAYMNNPLATELKSITTEDVQKLTLDETDVDRIRGKKVALLDDVTTTGGNMNAMENIVNKAGGKVVVKACVWVEGPSTAGGSAQARKNLEYIDYLPLFLSKEKYEHIAKMRES